MVSSALLTIDFELTVYIYRLKLSLYVVITNKCTAIRTLLHLSFSGV